MLGLPKKTRFGIVDWPAIARDIAPIAERVGITAPLGANRQGPVDRRELAHQHLAARWCARSRLIVMDEPTARCRRPRAKGCSPSFAISASGVAVLYVSHRLDEILDLCQRVTVFRDGQFGRRTCSAHD